MSLKAKTRFFATLFVALLTCIMVSVPAFASEYAPLSEDLPGVISNLQTLRRPVNFTNTQEMSDEITLMETSLLEIDREMSTRHSLFCGDDVVYSPSFEIVLSADRYDVVSHVSGKASEYFSAVSGMDALELRERLTSMAELLRDAAQYEIVGYDDTLFLSCPFGDTTLTMSYLKSEGASEHYTCFLNPLPGFNSAFRYMSMEDMSSLIEMEKQRGVGSWFAFSDTTTPLFDIEEDLWEIYWNIKSSFVNGSEYSITVLDENGAVVSEIPVGPERMIGSEYLKGPGRFRLEIHTAKGNWNIQAKEVPEAYAEAMGIVRSSEVQAEAVSANGELVNVTVRMSLTDSKGAMVPSSSFSSLESELLNAYGSFSKEKLDVLELNSAGNVTESPYVQYTFFTSSEAVSGIVEKCSAFKKSADISSLVVFSAYGDGVVL